MKNIHLLFLSILAIFFSSCETIVELDLESSPSTLVVEGFVTDQADMNYVKLTQSVPFAKDALTPSVTNAQVTVTDNAGNNIPFLHTNNGIYKPAAGFVGVPGRTYNLSINANGKTYTAASVLNPVPELDKIWITYSDGENDEYLREKGYYLSAAFTDPGNQKNYYKINIYQNGVLYEKNYGDVSVSEDRFYDGSYVSDIDFFQKFAKGDNLRMVLFSLDKPSYDFYYAVQQLIGQAGLFGRTPANVPTNISNGAVGNFTASAISTKTLEVQ